MIEISYTTPVPHRRSAKERSVFTWFVISLFYKKFLRRHNGFKFTRESQIEAMQLETLHGHTMLVSCPSGCTDVNVQTFKIWQLKSSLCFILFSFIDWLILLFCTCLPLPHTLHAWKDQNFPVKLNRAWEGCIIYENNVLHLVLSKA